MVEHASSWPPETSMRLGDVAREISMRLTETFHIDGIRQTGATLIHGKWLADVGIWPDSPELVAAVRDALAPMEVRTFPKSSLPRHC